MKSITIFFISFLFIFNSSGQTDFKADSIANTNASEISHLIDSTFRLDKNYDFEFRLWTKPSLVSYANVFILTQKNKIWTARFFEYYGNRTSKISERKVNQSGLDSLWKRLVANQVLTLPTQDSLKAKMRMFVADTSQEFDEGDTYKQVSIMDGTAYYFELATKGKNRSYYYHCPKGYLKYYSNVEELYRAFMIIVLVRKYLGLNLVVC